MQSRLTVFREAQAPACQAVLSLCIPPDSTIREAMACIDCGGKGIALLTGSDGRFLATITDGDIRRAILAQVDLDSPLSVILERKKSSPYPQSVTAHLEMSREEMLALLVDNVLHHLPVLDSHGRPQALLTVEDLLPDDSLDMEAVVMAGGFGKRLHPLTSDTPKPMLPVGGRPLLERAVTHLQRSGVRRVNVTTHYLPSKIIEHFGNGEKFGVELNYVNEECPLGTAGALRLLSRWESTILVMNGDLLTDINLRKLLQYHRESRAVFTVAVRRYGLRVPYGVVDSADGLVQKIVEKPELGFFVNAGIYLAEPCVRNFIPEGAVYNMPELVQGLLAAGKTVASFPILEYWLDIGQPADYEQAQRDIDTGRVAA